MAQNAEKSGSSKRGAKLRAPRRVSPNAKVSPQSGDLLTSAHKSPGLPPGTLIDKKYKIVEKVGGGGMGIVYKAEHVMMQRTVAVKMLHRHLAVDIQTDEFIRRFQREARTACRIEHPNAITIYDFGIHENQPYLVMQFNPGKDIRTVLKQGGPIGAERSVEIMMRVCKAVTAAHKLNIIHRDLKPDNIMFFLDEDGSAQVQVLDFGLAKVVDEKEGPMNTMTKTGFIVGTPQYIAPERAMGQKPDARSDIYSLGVILYEMLTGRLPFKANTPMELMLKHINDRPVPIRKAKPTFDIPVSLENVVMKALKKEPKNRQQSARELHDELSNVLNPPEPVTVRKSTSKAKDRSQDSPRGPGHRVAAAACALMLCAAVGFAARPLITYFSPEEVAKREAAEKRHQEALVHVHLARQLVREGSLSDAVAELIKATEITPKDASIYLELGNTYAKQNKLDQAIVVLENTLRLNPESAEAYFSLGNVLYSKSRFNQAMENYQKALHINPEHRSAREALRMCAELRSQNTYGRIR